jgi:hypothetical protein
MCGPATRAPAKANPIDIRLVYQLYDGRQISIFPASDGKDSYTLRVTAEDSIAPTQAPMQHPRRTRG